MKLIHVFWFFCSLVSYGQPNTDSSDSNFLVNVVSVLADDKMKGRSVGSAEELDAFNFISETFQKETNRNLKKQKFSFEIDSSVVQSQNGYSFLNFHKKQTIIIGAHYDHIGMGGKLSKSRVNDQIHNGADDNASGVALLLALSKKISALKNPRYNYLFVFYSAHEVGLFGSSAFYSFVKKKKCRFKEIALVINFDMIGRLDPELLKLKCMVSENAEAFLLKSDPDQFELTLNKTEAEKLKNLDTRIFLKNNIPCINFTTGMHNDYHSVSDDTEYINFQGLLQIQSFLLNLLENSPFSAIK